MILGFLITTIEPRNLKFYFWRKHWNLSKQINVGRRSATDISKNREVLLQKWHSEVYCEWKRELLGTG